MDDFSLLLSPVVSSIFHLLALGITCSITSGTSHAQRGSQRAVLNFHPLDHAPEQQEHSRRIHSPELGPRSREPSDGGARRRRRGLGVQLLQSRVEHGRVQRLAEIRLLRRGRRGRLSAAGTSLSRRGLADGGGGRGRGRGRGRRRRGVFVGGGVDVDGLCGDGFVVAPRARDPLELSDCGGAVAEGGVEAEGRALGADVAGGGGGASWG